jgi:hypothetical protein
MVKHLYLYAQIYCFSVYSLTISAGSAQLVRKKADRTGIWYIVDESGELVSPKITDGNPFTEAWKGSVV